MCSKMPHTRTFTATTSLYQQRCQVDYRVPYVLTKTYDHTEMLVVLKALTPNVSFINRTCSVNCLQDEILCSELEFSNLRQRVKEAVISLYSMYWTEHAPCFCSCDEVLVI